MGGLVCARRWVKAIWEALSFDLDPASLLITFLLLSLNVKTFRGDFVLASHLCMY